MRVLKVAISGVVAAILLLSAISPAIAAPEKTAGNVAVQFVNKTGIQIRITLTGPATVYLTIPTGKFKTELVPGIYHYSYFNCNKTITGIFKAKHAGANLVLPKCGKDKGVKEGKIIIKNETGGTLVLYLSGPQYYTFYVAPGKQKLTVEKGKYQYTGYGWCGSISGTIRPGYILKVWCITY